MKKTIKCMINNSTWISHEKNTVYRFINNSHLSINGKNHLRYSINTCNNYIEIQLGSQEKYQIEYVNDFILKIFNTNESFNIMPE